tara:strand:+ start:363 stop:599 length:237 start_codon:yes stop_codon:yes gene_type:complete
MQTKEIKRIAKRIEDIEIQLKTDYGLSRISGGFVSIDMIDYNKEFIYISIKDGVQSDCKDSVNTEQLKLDRKTLEFNN